MAFKLLGTCGGTHKPRVMDLNRLIVRDGPVARRLRVVGIGLNKPASRQGKKHRAHFYFSNGPSRFTRYIGGDSVWRLVVVGDPSEDL